MALAFQSFKLIFLGGISCWVVLFATAAGLYEDILGIFTRAKETRASGVGNDQKLKMRMIVNHRLLESSVQVRLKKGKYRCQSFSTIKSKNEERITNRHTVNHLWLSRSSEQ